MSNLFTNNNMENKFDVVWKWTKLAITCNNFGLAGIFPDIQSIHINIHQKLRCYRETDGQPYKSIFPTFAKAGVKKIQQIVFNNILKVQEHNSAESQLA